VEYLKNGFLDLRSRLARNQNAFKCSMSSDPFAVAGQTKPAIFYNLVRATWASRYNAGWGNPCRFTNGNGHDKGFEATLSSIVIGKTSIYHKYLPASSVERQAFQEIVNNFRAAYLKKSVPEQNENLKVILGLSEESHHSWRPPKRLSQEPTHLLQKGRFDVFSIPNGDKEQLCGQLDTRAVASGAAVKVLNQEFYEIGEKKERQRWALVFVPRYASFSFFSQTSESRCRGDEFYIRSEHLKQLPLSYETGTSYQAQLNGTGTLNVRRGPGTQFDTIGVLKAQDIVTVTGDDRKGKTSVPVNWYRVILSDGNEGWVWATRIDLIERL
jgi:hypothetical protein